MKKILVILISLCVGIACTITPRAKALPGESFYSNEEAEYRMQLQEPALEAYRELLNHFQKNGFEYVYPDEYAGEFIEDEILVILLKEGFEDLANKYINYCGDSKSVEIQTVPYSLKDFQTAEEVFWTLKNSYKIVSYGVDRKNNCFFAEVEQEDYDRLLADPAVKELAVPLRVNVQKTFSACANLYGGDSILNNYLPPTSYSVCIGGTYTNSSGATESAILTAGHGNDTIFSFYRNDLYVGKVRYAQCNSDYSNTSATSYGDFAIVGLGTNYTATNKVRNASGLVSITGTYPSVPQGTTLYKYGAATGYAWGYVTQANITVSYNSYYVRGMYESVIQNSSGTVPIWPGDSGGSVYINTSSGYKLQGLVAAGGSFTVGSTTYYRMYSSPMGYPEYFGFTPLTN